MRTGWIARQVRHSAMAMMILLGGSGSVAFAQGAHDHALVGQQPHMTPEQQKRANDLVQAVRNATADWQTPDRLPSDYQLAFGCVSGGDFGAMGLHYINMKLVMDGGLDRNAPEIVLYEPLPNGKQRITGADFIVDAATWDAKHPHDPPQLDGQLFHFFDKPNRFGLDPFYTLHVWAWKDNPAGTFTNWNPNVSCDGYNAPEP